MYTAAERMSVNVVRRKYIRNCYTNKKLFKCLSSYKRLRYSRCTNPYTTLFAVAFLFLVTCVTNFYF